jgi:two-component system, OmpR family, sensor histidine kinase KdpD
MVAGVTLIGSLLRSFATFDPTDVDMLYLLIVAISAAYLGFGPAIATAFLSVMAFDFFFIPPLLTFAVATEQGSINLLILFIAAIAIACLSPQLRR